jgi:hypothetical protein
MPVNICDLEKHALALEALLQKVKPSVKIEFVPACDTFLGVYRDVGRRYPDGRGGVYIFRVGSEVIYIGKANDFSRIWGHTGVPKEISQGVKEFSDCRFLTDDSLRQISEETKMQIRRGEFYIDCFVVNPVELCAVLETLLQSIYWLSTEKHPAANRQIG